MSALESLKLYEVLVKYFRNEKDAKIAVDAIENVGDGKINTMEQKLLTKDDKIDLIDRIHKAKIDTIVWLIGVISVHFFLIVLYATFFK